MNFFTTQENKLGFSDAEYANWRIHWKMIWCNGPYAALVPGVELPKINHPFKRIMRHHRIVRTSIKSNQ